MVRKNLKHLPRARVPDDDAGCLFVESTAGRSHEQASGVSAKALYLMRMSVKLVHLGPECVLDEIVLMRWVSEIQFDLTGCNLLLFDFFILLVRVIGGDYFPFHSLHLGH